MTWQDGFYWVKSCGRWQVGEWDQGLEWWQLCGCDIPALENDSDWGIAIDEVGPMIVAYYP